jgi:hypothetical protein
MEKLKKVIIKIHDDGAIEVVCKDKGVAVILKKPDGAETEIFEGEKKIWEKGQGGHDFPPQKRTQ